MRDVYKDEEIGFANRFEKEAKANGPTQREKDLARALDEMAKVARKEQCKAKEAYQKGHDQAVVESTEVIRHLNSQITGLKGVITIKNKELDNSAIVVAQKDEIIARKDEEAQNKLQALAAKFVEEINNNYISMEEHNKEIERIKEENNEFIYSILQEKYDLEKRVVGLENNCKDYEKRLHLIDVLANVDKPLPGSIK